MDEKIYEIKKKHSWVGWTTLHMIYVYNMSLTPLSWGKLCSILSWKGKIGGKETYEWKIEKKNENFKNHLANLDGFNI